MMEFRNEAPHSKVVRCIWIFIFSLLLMGVLSTPRAAEASGRIFKISANWNPTKTGHPTIITVRGNGRCGWVKVDFGDGTNASKRIDVMNTQNSLDFDHVFKSGPSVIVTATSQGCKFQGPPLTLRIKGDPIVEFQTQGLPGPLGGSKGAAAMRPGAPTMGLPTKPVGSNAGATSNTGVGDKDGTPPTGVGENTSPRRPIIKLQRNAVGQKDAPVPMP